MLLSDIDLDRALRTGELEIEPLLGKVQPSSVDLHLGPQIRVARDIGLLVDPTGANDDLWYDVDLESHVPWGWGDRFKEGGHFVMPPGTFLLGHTVERVSLGRTVAAYLDGRSTLARNGLSVHLTAGFIDPGFTGQITLEMQNVAPWPLLLKLNMPIAQLVVHRMSSVVGRAYGDPSLGSKYQRQEGATLARSQAPSAAEELHAAQAAHRADFASRPSGPR